LELVNNDELAEYRGTLHDKILNVTSTNFEAVALEVFRFQARYNPLYSDYIKQLKVRYDRLERLVEVPYLPIQFFKHHTIRTGQPPTSAIHFESSGTTGATPSIHTLYDAPLYQNLSQRIFEQVYGPLDQFHILALLPSYLERNNSSLVYMVRHFIEQTKSSFSGFYLNDILALTQKLRKLSQQNDGRKVLVLGVTFALLDWAESKINFSFLKNIPGLIIMETGGMKGRRKEILREEVHNILTKSLHVPYIHSEYGMTELLSQGYSNGEGLFKPGVTMQMFLRDPNDPFDIRSHGQMDSTGGINVVDLANLDTCSFIETQDLGRYGSEPDTFYVMGRFDNSDIRGCNLMTF
jgi:hypothetical protein